MTIRSPPCGQTSRISPPVPAPSAPVGACKPSPTQSSAAPTARKAAKAKLKRAIDLTREILGVPADYRIGIVPASDTGAVEMAMWSLLGPRPVTMMAWESFGEGWVTDVAKQLKLKDVTTLKAGYGELPDLSKVNSETDIVFTWNGTTSGARVPNADWIPPTDRADDLRCDIGLLRAGPRLAKLDVVTFSWQKVLGGEAAHGMLILSPRAVERLQTICRHGRCRRFSVSPTTAN